MKLAQSASTQAWLGGDATLDIIKNRTAKITATPKPESESNISIAEECNARATEINGLCGDWEPRNGTTVVMKAVDNQTVPKSLQGVLNDKEIYIRGNG